MHLAAHSLSDAPTPPVARDGAFAFSLPVHVFEKANAPEGKKRRFGGICTTDRVDRQGERILQDGLEWADFMENGWFNDNHSNKTADVLGYPDKQSLVTFKPGDLLPDGTAAACNGTWVEGYLLNRPAADQIWDLAQSLQGTGRSLGFSVEGNIVKRTGPGNKTIAKAKIRNVALTNCFPGNTRVVGAAEGVSRRHYAGPMVEIELATGQKLSGTPNHPVFTDAGWVALGLLDEKLHRVGCGPGDGPVAGPGADDVQNVPATLEQLFDAARNFGALVDERPGVELDFHGDGTADSQVDVVRLEGALRDRENAAFAEKFGKDCLATSDKNRLRRATQRAQAQLFGAGGHASAGGIGPQHAGAPFFGAEAGGTPKLFGGAVPGESTSREHGVQPLTTDAVSGGDNAAGLPSDVSGDHRVSGNGVKLFEMGDGNTKSPGDTDDSSSVNAESLSDADRVLSSAITFSNIARKRIFDFTGHVYNLETSLGWYEANNICSKNCPVNTDAKLEILARSLEAIQAEETQKAMGGGGPPVPMADAEGTGPTAGRIIAKEALEGAVKDEAGPTRKKKRHRQKAAGGNLGKAEKESAASAGLAKAAAIAYLQKRAPGLGYAAAERILALSKAGKTGEGSRGGRILGHTRSGKPIYAEGKAHAAGAAAGAEVAHAHKNYSALDHMDAALALGSRALKGGPDAAAAKNLSQAHRAASEHKAAAASRRNLPASAAVPGFKKLETKIYNESTAQRGQDQLGHTSSGKLVAANRAAEDFGDALNDRTDEDNEAGPHFARVAQQTKAGHFADWSSKDHAEAANRHMEFARALTGPSAKAGAWGADASPLQSAVSFFAGDAPKARNALATAHAHMARAHDAMSALGRRGSTKKSLRPAAAFAHLQARLPGLTRANAQKTLRIAKALEARGLI